MNFTQYLARTLQSLRVPRCLHQNTHNHRPKLTASGIGFVIAMGISSTAMAKDYIVEVILFENLSAGNVTEPHAYQAPEKPRTEAQAWLLETALLKDQAETIEKSSDYVLKHHFAWGQESLPYRQSATYTVLESDTRGYIKVYADNLLFANLDIDYKGFRMKEKRRLKLNEKHFFDHPKFGILMQVSRLESIKPGGRTGD